MRTPTTPLLAVLLVGLAPAGLEAQQPPRSGTIHVSGTGEVQVAPDLAHVNFAVESFAPTAREAGERNARAMDAVVRALRQAGASEGDIETTGFGVHPVYERPDRPPPRPDPAQAEDPRITGYRATNQVTLEIRDMDAIGRFIDAGLAAGANRLAGVRFGLRDTGPAQNDALRQAVARARESAATIADALGVGLGPVREVSTQVDPPGIFAREAAVRMDAAAAGAPPTPISPADQVVQARVQLRFEIVQP